MDIAALVTVIVSGCAFLAWSVWLAIDSARGTYRRRRS